MGKRTVFAAVAALGLTLSGAALAPVAQAASANEPAAQVMSVCSDAKREARELLRHPEIGRPTNSDDAGFLRGEMLWVANNFGGGVRQTARQIAAKIGGYC
jgi:hypothetical protein